jgi:hypothetical protein
MPHAKIGDINMYYEIHREAEHLVLITGLSSDHKHGYLSYQHLQIIIES